MESQKRIFWVMAGIFGALAVMLGAFGAHALSEFLEATGRTGTFQTAVQYQFWHALALMITATQVQKNHKRLVAAGYAFIVGTVFFSGSLYTLVFTGVGMWGALAPVGGVAFVVGWVLWVLHGVRRKDWSLNNDR
jgi:uncharacterized membrane protein YgdD (TMEM256/DUF423 family)